MISWRLRYFRRLKERDQSSQQIVMLFLIDVWTAQGDACISELYLSIATVRSFPEKIISLEYIDDTHPSYPLQISYHWRRLSSTTSSAFHQNVNPFPRRHFALEMDHRLSRSKLCFFPFTKCHIFRTLRSLERGRFLTKPTINGNTGNIEKTPDHWQGSVPCAIKKHGQRFHRRRFAARPRVRGPVFMELNPQSLHL